MLLGEGWVTSTRANESNWKAERKDNALESVMLFGGGWVKTSGPMKVIRRLKGKRMVVKGRNQAQI